MGSFYFDKFYPNRWVFQTLPRMQYQLVLLLLFGLSYKVRVNIRFIERFCEFNNSFLVCINRYRDCLSALHFSRRLLNRDNLYLLQMDQESDWGDLLMLKLLTNHFFSPEIQPDFWWILKKNITKIYSYKFIFTCDRKTNYVNNTTYE